MLVAYGDSNQVRVSLHPFDFTSVTLESMMRHALMDGGINTDADARAYFELL